MWFVLALIAALFWGGADLFAKMGTDPRDKYSHLRMVVMVGLVMGIHGSVLLALNYKNFDPMSFIEYLPVSACYIISMAVGYAGLRYLEISVSSPVCNCSGALVALMCFLFLKEPITSFQVLAILLMVLGVTLLSIFDLKDENKARRFRGEEIERKYQVSVLAVFIPIIYCIIDAIGTFGDSLVLDYWEILSEEEGEIAYEFTFLLCGFLAFLYLVFIKKERFSVKEEREKGIAAICETAGQFAYVYAIADNAVLAAPLVSSYCLFSVILSRIFLKERLTKRQYGAIAMALFGIVIMGFFE